MLLRYVRKLIFAIVMTMSIICCTNNNFKIDHTEYDARSVEEYFIKPIRRGNLELLNITLTDYDFQLMNYDGWGLYFDLVRIDFDSYDVEIIVQDTTNTLPRFFKIDQFNNEVKYVNEISKLIMEYDLWSVRDSINQNRLVDGGELSIILLENDRAKLITWQNIERNESEDKKKVENFYNDIWTITKNFLKVKEEDKINR